MKCSIKWKDKSHQSKCQKILCPSVYGTYKWIFSKERKTQLHQENDSIENIPDIYEHILGVSEMSSHGICQKHITNKCEMTSTKFFWEGSCFENKKLTHNLTTKLMILIEIFFVYLVWTKNLCVCVRVTNFWRSNFCGFLLRK